MFLERSLGNQPGRVSRVEPVLKTQSWESVIRSLERVVKKPAFGASLRKRRGQYGKWRSEGVAVRQRTGNRRRTCGKACRSPKSDCRSLGVGASNIEALLAVWPGTREGFAEVSSADKVAGASG
jgi:hypothetical protein